MPKTLIQWTADEIAYLVNNWRGRKASQIAQGLPNRTGNAVNRKIKDLGLRDNPDITAEAAVGFKINRNRFDERNGLGLRISGKSRNIPMKCLGCQAEFKSWDKARNRMCVNCRGETDEWSAA